MKHTPCFAALIVLLLTVVLSAVWPTFAGQQQESAREYFVSLQGSDDNNGFPREQAFRTVQRGVTALAAGDTLTIGPGEYYESVKRDKLGWSDRDTVIRAEIPGTVILRGDGPAPNFVKVPGYRFVYSAFYNQPPRAVLEHDTLSTLKKRQNVLDVEYDPGTFCYDEEQKKLYISTSDLRDPGQHFYTVATNGSNGLDLGKGPRRVIIDGLATAGFYPGWGIALTAPAGCAVRGCKAWFGTGGIILAVDGVGTNANGGSNNVVENCEAWGNTFGGIARYGANHDLVRNCILYKNVNIGHEHFGIIHYAKMHGPLIMRNNISRGHSFNYSVKPGGQYERMENCVTLGFIRINPSNMFGNLVGGGSEYDRHSNAPADNILFLRERELDQDFEFADPLNLDFRLQPGSRFRGTGPGGKDRGPYQYAGNIFYINPNGNDAHDGLSMRSPWQTLGRALKSLKPGDTLYLEEGSYQSPGKLSAGRGTGEAINIRGRGRSTDVITGRQDLAKFGH